MNNCLTSIRLLVILCSLQLARKPSTEQPAYLDVKKEIDEMKTEKLNSHQKIRDLLSQLDVLVRCCQN